MALRWDCYRCLIGLEPECLLCSQRALVWRAPPTTPCSTVPCKPYLGLIKAYKSSEATGTIYLALRSKAVPRQFAGHSDLGAVPPAQHHQREGARIVPCVSLTPSNSQGSTRDVSAYTATSAAAASLRQQHYAHHSALEAAPEMRTTPLQSPKPNGGRRVAWQLRVDSGRDNQQHKVTRVARQGARRGAPSTPATHQNAQTRTNHTGTGSRASWCGTMRTAAATPTRAARAGAASPRSSSSSSAAWRGPAATSG